VEKVLIDTSVLIAVERGDASDEIGGGAHTSISVVSVSELLYDVYRARAGRQPTTARRRTTTRAL
jgi:predicted nucleic acid-binding protein